MNLYKYNALIQNVPCIYTEINRNLYWFTFSIGHAGLIMSNAMNMYFYHEGKL